MTPIQRKTYLIKKSFQLRYVFIVSLFILITAVISGVMTYLALFPYLAEKLANVYPQGRLIVLLRDANAKAVLSSLIIIPFAAWLSIILSHRIAGPWYRLEMILKNLAAGDLSHDISLRKNDELQSLASSLNMVMRNLREAATDNIKYAGSIDEAIREIDQEINKDPADIMKIRLMINKMQGIISDLKESLKRHKLS
ncbi:MAG: methyl-accepting chemotaxis protein [Dehalococcoidia bacterium]|nr:MAG: methyl-accepting chemotaxis protein [Dehalococcoidia bacterium]